MYSDMQIGLVGSYCDMTYEYEFLGSTMKAIDELISGKDPFAKVICF